MAIKPIPFNAEMAQAILDGRKTQTRRIAFKHDDLREFRRNAYPNGWWYDGRAFKSFDDFLHYPQRPKCKYAPGDILYVPEAWKCRGTFGWSGYEVEFRDGQRVKFQFDDRDRAEKWDKYRDKPSHQWQSPYFMPREAARIFLRVKDVRVQQLNDMSEENAIAEGFADSPAGTDSPLERFSELWDKTIKREDLREYGWYANPWVWVIEFEQVEKPEGW